MTQANTQEIERYRLRRCLLSWLTSSTLWWICYHCQQLWNRSVSCWRNVVESEVNMDLQNTQTMLHNKQLSFSATCAALQEQWKSPSSVLLPAVRELSAWKPLRGHLSARCTVSTNGGQEPRTETTISAKRTGRGERSEQAVLLRREEVQEITVQRSGARKTEEFCQTNSTESHWSAAERNRTMFEGWAILDCTKKRTSEMWQNKLKQADEETLDSESLPRFNCWARYWQINTFSQWWDHSQLRGQTLHAYFCIFAQGDPSACQWQIEMGFLTWSGARKTEEYYKMMTDFTDEFIESVIICLSFVSLAEKVFCFNQNRAWEKFPWVNCVRLQMSFFFWAVMGVWSRFFHKPTANASTSTLDALLFPLLLLSRHSMINCWSRVDNEPSVSVCWFFFFSMVSNAVLWHSWK